MLPPYHGCFPSLTTCHLPNALLKKVRRPDPPALMGMLDGFTLISSAAFLKVLREEGEPMLLV